MLTIGKYKVCILDLVTDSRTGKLSGSKIWRHICFAILSKTMLTTEITWDLMLAYGGVVGSSEIAIMLIKYKYGGGDANKPDSEAS